MDISDIGAFQRRCEPRAGYHRLAHQQAVIGATHLAVRSNQGNPRIVGISPMELIDDPVPVAILYCLTGQEFAGASHVAEAVIHLVIQMIAG
ncbi:hypothetical protein A6A05_16820 [Magnetospirillum moscoviense]|uniref:Uncharacterized protein n=1 Tax=Magnetospirillum moscoviense TaxID=1437059 RepID=A0A178MBH7_9PROT|nr:hypothetical protein A6A05_16820 [Magnetospirillum moscoviense]